MDQETAPVDQVTPTWRHPTGKPPKTVVILGLGPTGNDWHDLHKQYDVSVTCDEVWLVNKGFRTQRCDLLFVMDDLIDEARKSTQYAADLAQYDGPIVTSRVDAPVADRFPRAIEYPLQDVLSFWGAHYYGRRREESRVDAAKGLASGLAKAAYFRNSIPYLLAYAGFIGVENIGLYGCDYNWPGQTGREDDKANTEFWVGALTFALGVDIQIAPRSTLMRTNEARAFYGFNGRQPY